MRLAPRRTWYHESIPNSGADTCSKLQQGQAGRLPETDLCALQREAGSAHQFSFLFFESASKIQVERGEELSKTSLRVRSGRRNHGRVKDGVIHIPS